MEILKLESMCEECGEKENLYIIILKNNKCFVLCDDCMEKISKNTEHNMRKMFTKVL